MSFYTDNVIKQILLRLHELQISIILKLNHMKTLNIPRKMKFSLKLTYYFINLYKLRDETGWGEKLVMGDAKVRCF